MTRLLSSMPRIPLFLSLSLLLVVGCADAGSTGPTAVPVEGTASARGGIPGPPDSGGGDDGGEEEGEDGSDPVVDATDPVQAPQDTTLDVEVLGDNFEPGSVAEFLLDETETDDITTNETRFVNKKRLVANITVSIDAATELYDVRVTTPPGRKGVGLELFEVASGTVSMETTIGAGSLQSDGNGPYVNQECGVESNWEVEPSFYDFRPLIVLNKKQEREIARDPACTDVFPRSATIDLASAVVRSYCVAPASQDECAAAEEVTPEPGTTLWQLAAAGIVGAPDPAGEPISTFAIRLFDRAADGDPSTVPGGLNTEYCLDDGRGRPLRFDPGRNPGSHELLVTTGVFGEPMRIESQGDGKKVGSCAHTRSDGTIVVLNLELDILIELVALGL